MREKEECIFTLVWHSLIPLRKQHINDKNICLYSTCVGNMKDQGKMLRSWQYTLTLDNQGCQLWMRVRREICEARPLAAYKCRASPKKADGGGGGGGGGLSHFFFLPQKFWQPFSHSRHIVHHKPLTSTHKKKLCEIFPYNFFMRESVRFRWNGVKCVSLTLNAWELAALGQHIKTDKTRLLRLRAVDGYASDITR